MKKKKLQETALYPPVKALLESQGYEVKSEIGAVDVMAVRGKEEPVIVELKTGFSLSLFHQAAERQAITDHVYLAVPHTAGRTAYRTFKRNLALCRRLGLGLITIRADDGHTTIHCDPGPYKPRKSKARTTRLLREFARRVGDPNDGGATRVGLVTTYRQDALKCLDYLHANGPSKASVVASRTGATTARAIMYDDHYGWFERVAQGIYQATPKGIEAMNSYQSELATIRQARESVQP